MTAPRASRPASAARGVAAFAGVFAALNLLARLRAPAFDANEWWIDVRPLPAVVGIGLVACLSIALLTWSLRPAVGRRRAAFTLAILLITMAIATANAVTFYRLRAAGTITTPLPLPLSAAVIAVFAWIAWHVAADARHPLPARRRWFVAGAAACALAFPLAQVACFGLTDYRRPADAIVVFGARAYADGRPSDALEDRTLTAIDLYRRGLAPRLIFSGGPGDGPVSEAQVMRRLARERGVPDSAITTDDAGLTTDATVRNAAALLSPGARVLAVTHAWHLPRAKLRFDRAGLTAYTVPADERGQPLRQTPYLVAREVPALWLYYLRALVG